MFFNSSAKSNLLSDLSANGLSQNYFGQICFDCQHTTSSGQRTNVHHQHFILSQLLYLQKTKLQ